MTKGTVYFPAVLGADVPVVRPLDGVAAQARAPIRCGIVGYDGAVLPDLLRNGLAEWAAGAVAVPVPSRGPGTAVNCMPRLVHMSTDRGLPPDLKEALRRGGNPYAKLAMFDADESLTPSSNASAVHEAERAYVRTLEDPYAWLSIATPVDERPAQPLVGVSKMPDHYPPEERGISMREFEVQCRRIFRQYIPAPERGRIRDHHRTFIERNRTRPPMVRYRLLEGLRKYDLSGIKGLKAQFNRERGGLSEAKLRKVEDEATSTKPQ